VGGSGGPLPPRIAQNAPQELTGSDDGRATSHVVKVEWQWKKSTVHGASITWSITWSDSPCQRTYWRP